MRHVSVTFSDPKPVYSDPDDADVMNLRERLLSVLTEAEEGTVIPLSLKGTMLSASCHARLLGPALRMVASGEAPGRYVVVEDPGGANDWDADAALRKLSADGPTKLVCVWNTGGDRPLLVGDVDRGVKETYDFVYDREQKGSAATTRELAEAYGMRIQAASNRVTKAASLGVVRTVEERPAEGGGVQRLLVPVR
jgi:hypothetical protein